jgi:hypothetical protein
MRHDRETIRAKLEWEGGEDGVTWFSPWEVPEELENLWRDMLAARTDFYSFLEEIYGELEVE